MKYLLNSQIYYVATILTYGFSKCILFSIIYYNKRKQELFEESVTLTKN